MGKSWVKFGLITIACAAVLFGPAFTLFITYDFAGENCPDIWDYLSLAQGDFTGNPVRKYRVLVPFVAQGVHFVFGKVFNLLAPSDFADVDFALGFSFLLVNTVLMSIAGMLLYRFLGSFKLSPMACVLGVLAVLTSRWAAYLSGLPYADSLYFLVLVALLFGIKEKHKGWLLFCIFVGPWAKESFIFVAPLIFFFGEIKKGKQMLFFAASGILVFTARYIIDQSSGTGIGDSLTRDLAHFDLFSH